MPVAVQGFHRPKSGAAQGAECGKRTANADRPGGLRHDSGSVRRRCNCPRLYLSGVGFAPDFIAPPYMKRGPSCSLLAPERRVGAVAVTHTAFELLDGIVVVGGEPVADALDHLAPAWSGPRLIARRRPCRRRRLRAVV